MPLYVEIDELEDEVDLLQYGQEEQDSLFRIRSEHFYPSADKDDLIAKPDGAHKFGSLEIVAKSTAIVTSRQTYAVLEWLGDVGGLNDSLYIIA